MEKFLTLAIESSCDETAAAVLEGERNLLSNVISSQIDVHKVFGGVVPEIASRHHLEQINGVIDQALADAGVSLDDIDLVGVTNGPGLIGALLVGVATAKAIAFAKNLPLVGVNHMKSHISANYIEHKNLEPPFLTLIVSGGHTELVDTTGYEDYTLLGETRDDAVGEAYDKVARVLGLGYPGGPKVDKLAKKGNPEAIAFKRVMLEKDSLDFSFSGIKTAVLNHINSEKQAGKEINAADVAASFQQSIIDVLVKKTMQAAAKTGRTKIVLAGGVAANTLLRDSLTKACDEKNYELYYPSLDLCTDNAAMVACAARYQYLDHGADTLDMDAYSNLNL